MSSNEGTDEAQETRKPTLIDMLLCRCASTEPQGSMGKDGKFHLNLRNSNTTKFDQLEDSVHRLCNNKKKSTSQQKYVPRPAHPLLQKKDANGEERNANGTSEIPPQAQGYVPRAPHPMLNKNVANGEKEATPEQDAPSNLEPKDKKDDQVNSESVEKDQVSNSKPEVEKDQVSNSNPEAEKDRGQEETDASTQE